MHKKQNLVASVVPCFEETKNVRDPLFVSTRSQTGRRFDLRLIRNLLAASMRWLLSPLNPGGAHRSDSNDKNLLKQFQRRIAKLRQWQKACGGCFNVRRTSWQSWRQATSK